MGWQSGSTAASTNTSARTAFSLVELLVVMAGMGVLVSLLLPALNHARGSARRVQCSNNLRQIGIAVHSYAAAHQHLPPPKVGTQFENRGGTWVLLLPHLEEGARWQAYDSRLPVDDPRNVAIAAGTIPTYLCPQMVWPRIVPETECGEKLGAGSYVISTRTRYDNHRRLDGAFRNPPAHGPYRLSFKHIKDGTSKTILAGEINYGHQDYRWADCVERTGQPRWGDATWAGGYWYHAWGHMSADLPELFNNSEIYASPNSARTFRSDHRGGVNFVMLDATVRFLTNDSDSALRAALVTRNGREQLTHLDP